MLKQVKPGKFPSKRVHRYVTRSISSKFLTFLNSTHFKRKVLFHSGKLVNREYLFNA